MSFIPSFLIGMPQPFVATFGAGDLSIDTVITGVNVNYAVVLFGGCNGQDPSGFVTGAIECGVYVLDSTHVRAFRLTANAGGLGNSMIAYGTVLEFSPALMRQPVALFLNKSVTFAHGLTLGPKAFLLMVGMNNALLSSSAITQAEDLFSAAKIDGANVDILESAISGSGGQVSFYIVDPR